MNNIPADLVAALQNNQNQEAIRLIDEINNSGQIKVFRLRNIKDQRVLHLATEYNCLAVVQKLMEDKRVNTNSQDKDGNTPLHIAARNNNYQISKLLLENRADIDASNKNSTVPIHEAAAGGSREVLELLMEEGADINHKELSGYNCLHKAAEHGHPDLVRFLLKNGAKHEEVSSYWATPLHFAAKNGHLDVVKVLVENKVDINYDEYTNPPLFQAAENDHVEIVKYLIQNGADTGHRSSTVFHTAARSNALKTMKYFLDQGLDINFKSPDDRTLLSEAEKSQKLDVFKFLLSKGVDVNIVDRDGQNILLSTIRYCCDTRLHTLLRYLLPAKMNLNAQDKDGKTILDYSIEEEKHLSTLLLFGLKSKAKLTPKILPHLSRIVQRFNPASDSHSLCIKGLEHMLDAVKSIDPRQTIKYALARVLVTQIDKMTTAIKKFSAPQSVDIKTQDKLSSWKSLLIKLDKQENIKVLFRESLQFSHKLEEHLKLVEKIINQIKDSNKITENKTTQDSVVSASIDVGDSTQGSLKRPLSDIESLEKDAAAALASLKRFKTFDTNEHPTTEKEVNCDTIAMEISGDTTTQSKGNIASSSEAT